jgi:hypothetical protein
MSWGSVLGGVDDRASVYERRLELLVAAIDIHKHAFQAAVFDPGSGELVEERFSADRESLGRWTDRWCGRVETVAIEGRARGAGRRRRRGAAPLRPR